VHGRAVPAHAGKLFVMPQTAGRRTWLGAMAFKNSRISNLSYVGFASRKE
jgi:hypothetical protein